jgi:hypothetical protein
MMNTSSNEKLPTEAEIRMLVSRVDAKGILGSPWPDEWNDFKVTYGERWNDPEIELLTEFGMPEEAKMAAVLFPGKEYGYPDYKVEVYGIFGNSSLKVKEGATLEILIPVKLKIYVWRIRLLFRNYPVIHEELWDARSELWIRRVLNAPGAENGSTAYYELAKGITFLKMIFKRISYRVGGPNNVKYPYSVPEKRAFDSRYRELSEVYKKRICKKRDTLLKALEPVETIREEIEKEFASLCIPAHILDRFLDKSYRPSERAARPMALENAAVDKLPGYISWKYNANELLTIQREGQKLNKKG